MRLLLISDTHIPKRARTLPNEVWAQVHRADIVIHAGDWTDLATFDTLDQHARRLIAVYGNNDGPQLQQRLPEIARVELDGLRFAVIHDSGPAKDREQRCDSLFPDTDVLIFGHSHIPWDTTTANGLRLLNPGSPTDRRRQPACTYMTGEIQDAQLRNVMFHALPARQ